MSYPGNPSLSADIQGRITETFAHTLEVASQGNVEEARLGCDFVLRLDPEFAPAQALVERLEVADGAVDVADLAGQLSGEAAPPVAAATEPAPAPTPEAAVPADPGPDLLGEMRAMLEARDFDALAMRAQSEGAAIAADPALQALMGEIQERMEAAHFAEGVLGQAASAIEAGDAEKATKLVEQARAIDPGHPELPAVEGLLVTATDTAPAAEPVFEMEPVSAEAAPESPAVDVPGDVAPAVEVDELPVLGDEPLPSLEGDELPSLDDDQSSLDGDDLPSLDGGELPSIDGDDLPSLGGDELPSLDGAALPSLDDEALPELGADDLPALDLELPADGADEFGVDLDEGGLPVLEEADELPSLDVEAEAPAPAAAPSGPSDPDERIAALLDEGQAAFESGEHQTAIDSWSRIFLIDIDHDEAARRIEVARKAKDEHQRLVEEAYHDAVSKAEEGDEGGARAGLEKVLEMQPGHALAQEALERLDQGDLDTISSAVGPSDELSEPIAPADVLPDAVLGDELPVDDFAAVGEPLADGEVPVPKPTGKPAAKSSFKRAAAGIAAALVLGGGFLFLKWDSLFPNTEELPTQATAPRQSPIDRATELYEQGKVSMAISQLRRLPPASPFYDEATRLVTEWEADLEPQDSGPSEADIAERSELVNRARAAIEERRYLAARPFLDSAARISPLQADEEELAREIGIAIEPYSGPMAMLQDGEYERALRDLWRIREADETAPDPTYLLVTAYFNLGVRSLQLGQPSEARPMFEEATGLDPSDAEVARLLELSTAYSARQQDMLFRIFVKYLTPREL